VLSFPTAARIGTVTRRSRRVVPSMAARGLAAFPTAEEDDGQLSKRA
jgi:hypothetical protein